MSNYDAIIVGAGLGGLVAGAKLCKENKKVLLIEQHHTVGGCATSFKRKNFEFEVGLHEMDGLGNVDDPKQEIFKDLGVFSNVEFIKVPEFFRLRHGEFDFVMPEGVENAINELCQNFPLEKKNIENFFDEMKSIVEFKKMKLMKRYKATVGQILDEYFSNNDLKLSLSANLAYYHDNAYELSFIYFSFAQLSYLSGGGWYIKGGSLKLSQYLSDYIVKNGGEIILKHEVKEILLDEKKKRAIGVSFFRTKRENPELRSEYATTIIANTAVPNIPNLIPSLKKSKFKDDISQKSLPCSLLSIYLAFSDHEFENKYYSTFYYNESQSLQEIYDIEKSDDHSKKSFVFVDYGVLNEVNQGTICVIDYFKNWVGLDKEKYKERKKKIMETYIDRLDEKIPGIKEKIVYSEMATPITILKYTKNPNGVVYGFTQTPDMIGRQRLEASNSPIDNLYIASAWGNPGGGYSGAISAGYKTASMLLKKNLI
jgi:phytoene dehydrogenase-like protein